MKVRKKPIVVEAVQWTGTIESLKEIKKLGENTNQIRYSEYLDVLIFYYILGIGSVEVKISDWIIKGVNGELYPCKPDIFEKTYEIGL